MNKANECTCPSGDGSLVHPCPAHPAVEQVGGDERDLQGAQGERDGWGPFPIVQVPWNVFDRAVMWVEDRRRYGDDGTIVDDWKALKTIQRAALAQPSPALPPFAEKVLAKLRRFYDCASDFESGGVDIGRHWLDLLTQLGLLNRVQRSPALWEISQQGEDLLGMPQPSPAQAEAARLREENANLILTCASLDSEKREMQHKWDAIIAERDAALTRVAELEKQERPEGPTEDELEAAGLGYPLHKEEAVKLWYSGFRSEVITVLEAWEAIGHDIGMNPDKGELLDSLRYMLEKCEAHDAALAEVAGLRSLLNSLLCYVERDIDRMRSDRDKSDNKEIYDRSISLAMERLKAAQNAVFTTEPGCDTAVELAAQTTQAQHSVPELLVRAEDFVSGKEVPQAWLDVQAERRRQITAEGWTPEHDDLYCAAELPRAAAAYILNGANDEAPAIWPFSAKWWKPRDARSNYVRAGALILAEIERLDRAAPGKEGNDD